MSDAKHPAIDLPMEQRVDYLTVVASMAGADGEVVGEELGKLSEYCIALGLGANEIGRVIAAAQAPDAVRIREVTRRLRTSPLRFTLMTDLLFMAYADDKVVDAEERELNALADALNVTSVQVSALRKYVEAVRTAANNPGVGSGDMKKLGGDVAAGLASAGVPVAAVAVSGTVFGLSAAGITSGLAALGMGLGMATGLGVAVGIGVGSYFGVRWIYRKVVGA